MNRLKKKYSGVIVPMVTPFDNDGRIDLLATERITEFLLENGTSPFVLGTTGESASIPDEYRLNFVKNVVKITAGRSLTFAGIASNCFESSVNLAKHYFDFGVDAVVAHLPGYYPLNKDQMLSYFESLADACQGPMILYNIPKTTHHSIPLDLIDHLGQHSNICGLKDSERDLARLEKAISMWKERPDFSFLIGWAAQSSYGLSLGADGIVPSTGNIIPDMYSKIYNAVLRGDSSTAFLYQQKTGKISQIYQKDKILSESIPALKIIMNYLGLCGPHVLPPLIEPSNEVREDIHKKMKVLGLMS